MKRKSKPIVLMGHKVVLYVVVGRASGGIAQVYRTRRRAREWVGGDREFYRIVRGVFTPQGRA